MKTAKQHLLEVLERLPDDTPMDTLLTEMHSKAAILRGLEEIARGDVIPHEEIEKQLEEWRASSGLVKRTGT